MKSLGQVSFLFGAFGLVFAACGSESGSENDGAGARSNAKSSVGGNDANTESGGSSGGKENGETGGENMGGASSGGSGTGGDTDMGGAALGGAANEFPTDIVFTYDPEKNIQRETCAEIQIESSEVYLDMFIILDQSGSMGGETGQACSIGTSSEGTRWCNAVTALSGFFGDPSSVGMGVAYAEFGLTGCGEFPAMDVPFDLIEAGDANGQLAALNFALANDGPTGGTATEGAVRTLIEQSANHITTGTRRAVTILITDGEPSRCLVSGGTVTDEMRELNGFLFDHYQATDIPNFIIGMDGASGALLETLALGVGADPHPDNCLGNVTECSYYSVGAGDPSVFIAALESIRKSAVGCEYAIPETSVGLSVIDSLKVQFTQDLTADPELLGRVMDEASCAGDTEFWLDTSDTDTSIVKLCPETCDRRGPDTAVDLSLVCEGT